MTTRNEKLQSILDSRNACLSALISKGSTVTSATPFSEYAAAIRAIEGGGGGGTLDNADMVYAGNVAYIRMTVTGGTVDIDWGDGKSETIQSSSTEQSIAHEYATPGLYGISFSPSSDVSISFGGYAYYSIGYTDGKKSAPVMINRMPDGTSIGERAFSECNSLVTISLPNGVTSIGDSAFEQCNSLMTISLPNGMTSIGERAFSECRTLTTISLPGGLTSISYHAFSYCLSLMTISLPGGLTSIATYAFFMCTMLETIYSKALTPPILSSSNSLPGTSYVKNIYVPVGCADAYKSATNWSKYAGIISEMNVEDMP